MQWERVYYYYYERDTLRVIYDLVSQITSRSILYREQYETTKSSFVTVYKYSPLHGSIFRLQKLVFLNTFCVTHSIAMPSRRWWWWCECAAFNVNVHDEIIIDSLVFLLLRTSRSGWKNQNGKCKYMNDIFCPEVIP